MFKTLLFLVTLSFVTTSITAQIGEKKVFNIDFSDFNIKKENEKRSNSEDINPTKEISDLNILNFKKTKPSLSILNNSGFVIKSNINPNDLGKLNPKNRDVFGKKSDIARYKIKKLPKQLKNIEPGAKLVFTDQNLGEIITQSEYLDIYYRDHGQIDGDIIKINVDEAPFVGKVVLGSRNKSVRLYLKPGFTKIDLYSVFDGRLYPNTVEWVIKDDQKRTVADNVLSVSKGFKGTIVVIKN